MIKYGAGVVGEAAQGGIADRLLTARRSPSYLLAPLDAT
jgi:hypothetical protein